MTDDAGGKSALSDGLGPVPAAWKFARRYGSGLSFTKPVPVEDAGLEFPAPTPLYDQSALDAAVAAERERCRVCGYRDPRERTRDTEPSTYIQQEMDMIDTRIEDANGREIVAALLFVTGIVLACCEGASVWPQVIAVGLLAGAVAVLPPDAEQMPHDTDQSGEKE